MPSTFIESLFLIPGLSVSICGWFDLEHAAGFEPAIIGFAIQCLNRLGYACKLVPPQRIELWPPD